MGAFATAWHGAKSIVGPVLFLVGMLIACRVAAWIVKAKRGY